MYPISKFCEFYTLQMKEFRLAFSSRKPPSRFILAGLMFSLAITNARAGGHGGFDPDFIKQIAALFFGVAIVAVIAYVFRSKNNPVDRDDD